MFTSIVELLSASIIRASKMSVNFYRTAQHNIPEDSHL
jgi:hypothetical protein